MSLGKILYIEDEAALAEIIRESLEAKGFLVSYAAKLSSASFLLRESLPDIIVVDVMLPDGDGFEWVASLRKRGVNVPVIFLTSRSQTSDVVKGFELGGNDYVKKPFSIAELVVRIQALLKKQAPPATANVQEMVTRKIGKLTFIYPAGELETGANKIQLTSREADLLDLLLLHRNRPINREEMLQKLWGSTDYFSGRSLDVFISRLRKYLSADACVKIINVRGVGYKLVY
ncbi:MAG TPA: response regulator transcription factor [Flavobacterium sp.]|nr:response regulator transcription factor [Flavobacterium sp.]